MDSVLRVSVKNPFFAIMNTLKLEKMKKVIQINIIFVFSLILVISILKHVDIKLNSSIQYIKPERPDGKPDVPGIKPERPDGKPDVSGKRPVRPDGKPEKPGERPGRPDGNHE